MTLHPALQAALDQAAGLPAIQTLPLETVRAAFVTRYAAFPRPEVGLVEDRLIPGPRGELKVRIYRPDRASPRPVVLFFHGGGFVLCSVETHDGFCRQICNRAHAVVVSVEYALAPEDTFPAAPDDCLAAARWVGAHADSFGGDPDRIVLAGDSAGGGLAAVTAIRLRDEGGPRPAAQILMYPVIDHYSAGTPSYTERGTACGLTGDAMRWFWDLYLGDAADAADPKASLSRTESLAGLPPAYVVVAEYDPLRDEGLRFAERLRQAGVPTECLRYGDMNHGFISLTGLVDRADEALDAACAWLKTKTG